VRLDVVRLDTAAVPIDADDDAIRAAVADADPVPLLVSVAYITGDASILRDDLRPDPGRVLEPTAGLDDAQIARIRELAVEGLIRHREAGCPPAPQPSSDAFRRMLDYLVGPENTGDYYDVLIEELAVDEVDRRAPTWRKNDVAPDVPFSVAVVGAGMSGLLMAHRLDQAGIDFTIFEKNPDVGGTWFENVYPGCRVDVPNHLYSYSFAQTNEWPQFFSTQDSLLEYFRACADTLGLREHIRFDTEVLDADWDEDRQLWSVRVRTPSDTEETHDFQAIVSAVGQLNRPNWPDIPGRDRYTGPSFHSAQWDHSIDLTDKRVVVIGTGASAAQFIPIVAEQAGELVVLQRTPPWLAPTPNYHDSLPSGLRWVLTHVPSYARWDRLWLFWRTHEGALPAAKVDPEWTQDGSVSAPNEMVRLLLMAYLRMEFPDDELFAKITPAYPPIAKRILRDNGIWGRTLARDNVSLVTEPIAEITEKGVKMKDGTEYIADVLIYGTGFQASRFLTPMKLHGRAGVDIHERWDGEARAYLGMTVPEFPNLFLMYGPNTNIVINGSITYFSECEARYIVDSIGMLLRAGHRSMECRAEVHDGYNVRVDEANREMAWGHSTVNTWYKNASGRITQNWPWTLLEYWEQTREPNPNDYVLR
jgi:4-hydroxyacetophenone monooxygenase